MNEPPKNYFVADMPFDEGRMIKLGDLPVLLLKGLRLAKGTQQHILGEYISPDFSIDLINVATDEINPDENDINNIVEEYKSEYGIIQYLKTRLRDSLTGTKNFEAYINTAQKTKKYAKESGRINMYTSSETQLKDLHNDLLRVFHLDGELLKDFREKVLKFPQKKLLIVYGHGSGSKNSPWIVGEQNGPTVELDTLFSTLNPSDYSAVVLLSCNEAHKSPPSFQGVPIYYVNGISVIDKKMKGARN